MAEYTRLSVTANLGFVSTEPEQLEEVAKEFQSKLTKLLTANDSILPEEISISLSKMEGQNFTFKNNTTGTSASYHLSIMAHIRSFDSKPLAEKVYIKLADLVKEYKAEVVIFSLLADEKYSSNHVLKKGQYIHF